MCNLFDEINQIYASNFQVLAGNAHRDWFSHITIPDLINTTKIPQNSEFR